MHEGLRIVNLDTDRSVKRQGLERHFKIDTVALSDIANNLRFYADSFGVAECGRRMDSLKEKSFCLLGSGDFHHLTLLRLERVMRPFHLVVFDNHLDSSFVFPRYHCGNWMYHASRLPLCGRVTHIGSNDHRAFGNRFGIRPLEKSGRLSLLPGAECAGSGALDKLKRLMESGPEGLPLYISIDKDVLNENEAPGDWDNGTMDMRSLTKMIEWIGRSFFIAGGDITGEMGGKFSYRNKPLKNFFSFLEHPERDLSVNKADSKHLLINIELMDILGAVNVAG